MIQPCTPSATYSDYDEAKRVARNMKRDFRLRIGTTYCEQCDAYHLKPDTQHDQVARLRVRFFETLKLTAQGFSAPDVARIQRIQRSTVEWRLRMLRGQFYALSTPHLIAITISLGLLDPNDFVPKMKEHT